jgi:hypothetical protein
MTTPYTYLATQTMSDKEAADATTTYDATTVFWASVVGVLVLAGIVLVVLYGLSQKASTLDADYTPFTATRPPAVLAQLPLYLGSTQFSDPPEDA